MSNNYINFYRMARFIFKESNICFFVDSSYTNGIHGSNDYYDNLGRLLRAKIGDDFIVSESNIDDLVWRLYWWCIGKIPSKKLLKDMKKTLFFICKEFNYGYDEAYKFKFDEYVAYKGTEFEKRDRYGRVNNIYSNDKKIKRREGSKTIYIDDTGLDVFDLEFKRIHISKDVLLIQKIGEEQFFKRFVDKKEIDGLMAEYHNSKKIVAYELRTTVARLNMIIKELNNIENETL